LYRYAEVSSSAVIRDQRCAIGGSTELGGVTRVKGVDPNAGRAACRFTGFPLVSPVS
jgi:hypothetical protein